MPRVDGVDVSVYVVPLEEPESDATLTWKETTVIVAEPFGGGARGLGFSYATAACAPFIRDLLAPTVTGREILDVPGSWRKMVEAIRNVGRPGVTSMAIAAVDIGLWDLKAKLLDLPLCRLLGMCHDRVAIYGRGGFTSLTAEQLTGQVDGWVNGEGIPRVKMKIGTEHGTAQHRDLQRVELVRQTIGDDAELYVDANGGYTRKQAVRLAASFREMGVTWFEEPVSSDDLVGLHEVRSLIDLDVAAGEYGYDLATSGGCVPQEPSMCCKPTCLDAPGSPSGCAPPRSQPRTACRSPRIALHSCICTRRVLSRTFATSSTSPITSASITCCSTA